MPALTFELRAEMEDGTTFDVVADQRDMAKWEVQPFGCPFAEFKSRMFTALRFLAWSAGTRQGHTALSWLDFDAKCIEVGDVPELEAAADPDAENPGQTTQSGMA